MLFGSLNSSSVWGLDGTAVFASGENSVQIGPDQMVCVLQLRGECQFLRDQDVELNMQGEGVLFINGLGDSRNEIVFPKTMAESDGIVLGFGRSIIQQTLKSVRPGLNADVQNLLFGTEKGAAAKVLRMPTLVRERVISDFRDPPVKGAAAGFWYESRVREVIALCFFHEQEPSENFFCSRQKRIARERIEQTKNFIAANLDQAFDLKAAAEFVGCSGHYLSRTFSESVGMTITQYLRQVRIERAAELLRSGRYNVSEAAVEVGYQSLSHFSKAFQQEKGVLPSRYDFGR